MPTSASPPYVTENGEILHVDFTGETAFVGQRSSLSNVVRTWLPSLWAAFLHHDDHWVQLSTVESRRKKFDEGVGPCRGSAKANAATCSSARLTGHLATPSPDHPRTPRLLTPPHGGQGFGPCAGRGCASCPQRGVRTPWGKEPCKQSATKRHKARSTAVTQKARTDGEDRDTRRNRAAADTGPRTEA